MTRWSRKPITVASASANGTTCAPFDPGLAGLLRPESAAIASANEGGPKNIPAKTWPSK